MKSAYEKRIKSQADIQDYVDMSISSTINLPAWGSKGNSEADVERFAETLSKYAPRLRGFTCYPDGSRGGQPLTEVPYEEAVKHKGVVFEENIDRFREAARETLRTTVTYTIYDRETNQSTSGSFTEQTSYTLSDSEISRQLEQATARSTISQSVQARIQNELLKANKTK